MTIFNESTAEPLKFKILKNHKKSRFTSKWMQLAPSRLKNKKNKEIKIFNSSTRLSFNFVELER